MRFKFLRTRQKVRGYSGISRRRGGLKILPIILFGFKLPYSRTYESEADEIGLVYLAKACFNPELASTHPAFSIP